MANTENPTTAIPTYHCHACGTYTLSPDNLCDMCWEAEQLAADLAAIATERDEWMASQPYDVGRAFFYRDDPYVDWVEDDDPFS